MIPHAAFQKIVLRTPSVDTYISLLFSCKFMPISIYKFMAWFEIDKDVEKITKALLSAPSQCNEM